MRYYESLIHDDLWVMVRTKTSERPVAKWSKPFRGDACVETGLHLCTGEFVFLCFEALPEAPCGCSIANDGKPF
jgi:hypothetical protein